MHPSKLKRPRRSGAAVQRPHGHQFGMVDAAIVRDETLPRNVKTIYTYLATFADTVRDAFPSRARMARETGLSVSAIDEAKKIGSDCGLWTIEHDYDVDEAGKKTYSSNVYFLHDQGGGYVPGSGPGARQAGKPRGPRTSKGGGPKFGLGVAQQLDGGGPKSGPYQDQPTEPPSIRTNASSGDAPAGAHEQARGRANESSKRIHIDRPTAVDERELSRKLVAALTAAMKKAGKPLGSRGKKDLGAWVKEYAGQPVDALAAHLEDFLTAALAGDHPWLFEDLDKPTTYPNTDDGFEQLHDDYDGLPGATATIDSMWPDGYHPNTIAATINKQLSA